MASTPPVRYPLRAAVQRTGLKADRIRSWETRYGAVEPGRSDANQRLYSAADIDRLRLLKTAIESGLSISRIAKLPDEEIRRLTGPRGSGDRGDAAPPATEPLPESIEAIRALDSDRLRRILERQMMKMGRIEFLDRYLAPLMAGIGARYDAGELRIVHEHLASATIRAVLDSLRPAFPPEPSAPGIVIGTPRGQHHELAALLAAAAARIEGWRVSYLGSNLPAEEFAAAVEATDPRAVALSLTVAGDSTLGDEFRRLRSNAPNVPLLVGGRAIGSYGHLFSELEVETIANLTEFRQRLEQLQSDAAPAR